MGKTFSRTDRQLEDYREFFIRKDRLDFSDFPHLIPLMQKKYEQCSGEGWEDIFLDIKSWIESNNYEKLQEVLISPLPISNQYRALSPLLSVITNVPRYHIQLEDISLTRG